MDNKVWNLPRYQKKGEEKEEERGSFYHETILKTRRLNQEPLLPRDPSRNRRCSPIIVLIKEEEDCNPGDSR